MPATVRDRHENGGVGSLRIRTTVAAVALVMAACGGGGSGEDAAPTGTWRDMAVAPIAGRSGPATEWTGKEMLVWGGGSCKANPCQYDNVEPIADGAAYDPVTDRWRPLEPVPLVGRGIPITAWDGRGMLLWGGLVVVSSPASSAEGVRYTP